MGFYRYQIKNDTTLIEWFKSMKVSKNKINYLIDNHFCYLNDQILNKDSKLKKDDFIFIDLTNYHDTKTKETKKFVDILYEDDYIIVVNKPKGYIIYSDDEQITMTDIVGNYLKSKDKVCFAAHRLDTETTGCLVFCKDIITLAYLSYIFETKDINKEYLAVVEGKTDISGTINLPIGTDRHVNNKMVVSKNGKLALTKYKTEKHINNKSLIRVVLVSGRTHQIRVHMAHIGHPLIGDIKYGSKINVSRTMLHCSSISFKHPYYDKIIQIKCNMPQDMSKLVK